jgi:hypothetical protein
MHHDNLSINTITYKCVPNKPQHFFSKIMFAGTLIYFSLKVEKYNAPADVQRLISLPVRINYLPVCVRTG